MVRTQIQLTEEQHERLRVLAQERRESISALAREGIELLLGRSAESGRWDRLFSVVGKFSDLDGANDVSEKHDQYLTELWAREPRIR